MICFTCFSSLALTGSEQLFTSDFSARITSGRRGQTCHIKKFPSLQSHTDLTLSTGQPRPPACRASPAEQRSCGSANRKASGLGTSPTPSSSSWTWQPQLPPHQQQPHSVFPSNEIHCEQTSPPPSHWMKSQYPSVAFRLLALVGSCRAK